MNIKIVWGIVTLVVVGGAVGAYLYTHNIIGTVGGDVTQKTQTELPPSLPAFSAVRGIVTGVSTEKLQLTIQISTTSPTKTVIIRPTTKIEKTIVQKDASGAVEKQTAVEVNIGEVRKGNLVTVIYQSDIDNILDGVEKIMFSVGG